MLEALNEALRGLNETFDGLNGAFDGFRQPSKPSNETFNAFSDRPRAST